jgi:hypothetical protein
MSNSLYDSARKDMLDGNFNWTDATNPMKALLWDSSYGAFNAANVFVSDLNASGIVGPRVQLASPVTTGGAADANDVTFGSVTGASCEAVILYRHYGADSSNKLVAYIDSATGLPITPNTGDIIVVWDNGTNKIFRP